MTRRRLTLTGFVIAVISAVYLSVQTSVGAGALPDQLSDKAFWALSNELSEENGYFRSDNLVSNEVWMQYVIADLVKTTKPGRVYLGVGPEQNFTYIAAVKPAMVFIVDVRRENLQLHLMYKALFELSKDRAEFVSRLFSKKRPQGLTTKSSAEEIFNAYAEVPTSEALYKENLKAVQDHLLKTRGLPLNEEDLKGVEYVAYQFYWFGPVITYSSTNPTNGRMRGGNTMPTYYDVMLSTDADGKIPGLSLRRGQVPVPETAAQQEHAGACRRQFRRDQGVASRRTVSQGARRDGLRRTTCPTSSSISSRRG